MIVVQTAAVDSMQKDLHYRLLAPPHCHTRYYSYSVMIDCIRGNRSNSSGSSSRQLLLFSSMSLLFPVLYIRPVACGSGGINGDIIADLDNFLGLALQNHPPMSRERLQLPHIISQEQNISLTPELSTEQGLILRPYLDCGLIMSNDNSK